MFRKMMERYRLRKALHAERAALLNEGFAYVITKRSLRARGIEVPAEWAAKEQAIMDRLMQIDAELSR